MFAPRVVGPLLIVQAFLSILSELHEVEGATPQRLSHLRRNTGAD